MKRLININSEITPLKKVLMHRPGNEFLNLTPNNYQELLMRNIPFLELMQKEHDAYANMLRKEGIDVLYLTDLIVECLNTNPNIKQKFIKQFVKEANIKDTTLNKHVYDLLNSIKDNRKLINKCIEGIRISEVNYTNKFYYLKNIGDLVVNPLPNLCYIGDLISGVGNSVLLNKMNSQHRNRESIFLDYIFKYHPKYKNVQLYYDRYQPFSLEGGDIFVLNDEVLCIGLSMQTDISAIELFAKSILNDEMFKYVLVIDIEDNHKFSHLDNVFARLGTSKFLVSKDLMTKAQFYELTLYNGDLNVNEVHADLDKILKKYLHLENITLIECGNGDSIDGSREQWNEAINVLVLKSDVVIAYKQNIITNQLLKENGVKVIEIAGNSLLSGQGGPRSLVSPLIKEK